MEKNKTKIEQKMLMKKISKKNSFTNNLLLQESLKINAEKIKSLLRILI